MKYKNELERLLEISVARVHKEGHAYIRKMDKGLRPYKNRTGAYLSDGSLRRCVYPPYVGAIKGGQMIVFDIVAAKGQAVKRSTLSLEQIEALEGYRNMGAKAYIFISFGDGRKFYRVPVRVWKKLRECSIRTLIMMKDISEFEVKFCNGTYDFFSGLLEG